MAAVTRFAATEDLAASGLRRWPRTTNCAAVAGPGRQPRVRFGCVGCDGGPGISPIEIVV